MNRQVVRFDPVKDFQSFSALMDRLFDAPFRASNAAPTTGNFAMPVDILEQDGKLLVRASVPGIDPANLDVSIENDVLTLSGETVREEVTEGTRVYRREVSQGKFTRSIRLPENLDLDAVDATFRNGIVEIVIPFLEEAKPEARKIQVRQADTLDAASE